MVVVAVVGCGALGSRVAGELAICGHRVIISSVRTSLYYHVSTVSHTFQLLICPVSTHYHHRCNAIICPFEMSTSLSSSSPLSLFTAHNFVTPLSSSLQCTAIKMIPWLKVRVWDSSSPAMDQLPAQACHHCHHRYYHHHCNHHHRQHRLHRHDHHHHNDFTVISLHMSGLRQRLGDSW